MMSIGLLVAAFPLPSVAEIIWTGDFETGNYNQWHTRSNTDVVGFFQMPAYGRPKQYPGQTPLDAKHVGNGELCSLVAATSRTVNGVNYPAGPTRNSNFASKFTVKSASDGAVETADCDNGNCTRRRTVLTVQQALPENYDALPYMGERWFSVSVYLPSDWEEKSSGWGPNIFAVKPLIELGDKGVSGMFDINIEGSSWRITHRWSGVQNPTMDDVPWQQQMLYTNDFIGEGGGPYPSSDRWQEGLEDYPNVADSQAALGDLNKGGWTDWVVHLKFDARGSEQGGTGFIEVWKRSGDGPWVHVLHIVPKVVSRGYSFDRGIGYNSPASSSTNGGFGIKAGLYMDKSQVWNNQRSRVLYMDNIKVGDSNTLFSDMSPDGSSPGSAAAVETTRPMPPTLSAE